MESLRDRAGLDLHEAVPAEGLFRALDRERQIEFAFEGKRWFDLLRSGTATEQVPTVISSEQLLFPVPLSEILANPFIGVEDQNPGY